MGELEPLRRSTADAKIAGVCGGVAERAGIDPLLVRLAAVVLALCSGIGAVLYVCGWLALPRGAEPPAVQRLIPATARWSGRTWVLIVGGITLLVVTTVGQDVTIGLVPAIVVAGLWFAGAIPSQRLPPRAGTASDRGPAPASRTPSWPVATSADEWSAPVTISTRRGPWTPTNPWGHPVTYGEALRFFALPDPAGLYAATPAPSVGPQARGRWAMAGLLGVLLVVLAAMSDLGIPVPPAAYLAAALVVAGLSLVLTARSTRPKGLLAMTLALGLVTGAMAVPQGRTFPGPTSRYIEVESSSALPRTLDVDMGSTTLDLSRASLTEPVVVEASVWMGTLTVVLPEAANVSVDWVITSGAVTCPDQEPSQSGSGTYRQVVDPNAAMTTIRVTIVDGELEVVTP